MIYFYATAFSFMVEVVTMHGIYLRSAYNKTEFLGTAYCPNEY